jgi:hypothetical protein
VAKSASRPGNAPHLRSLSNWTPSPTPVLRRPVVPQLLAAPGAHAAAPPGGPRVRSRNCNMSNMSPPDSMSSLGPAPARDKDTQDITVSHTERERMRAS